MALSRRSLLRAGGLAAVLGTTGLAGCSGALSGGGGRSPGDWQFDPGIHTDSANVFFGTADYAGLYEHRTHLPASTRETLETSSAVPLESEQIETVTGVGAVQFSSLDGSRTTFGSVVILGSFDRADAEQLVETQGSPEASRQHRAFTLYEGVDGQEAGGLRGVPGGPTPFTMTAVAVGDGAMVVGASVVRGRNSGMVLARDVAATTIDAATGNAPRLQARNRRARRLAELVEDPTLAVGLQADPELLARTQQAASGIQERLLAGLRGAGFGMAIDGASTTQTLVGFYEDSDTAAATDAVELVDGMQVTQREAVERVDATVDGDAVVVTVTGNTRGLLTDGLVPRPGGGPAGISSRRDPSRRRHIHQQGALWGVEDSTARSPGLE